MESFKNKKYTNKRTLVPLLLSISTLFLIGRPQDFIPGLSAIRPGYVILILLIILVIGRSQIAMNGQIIKILEVQLTLSFFILIFLSFFWAEIHSASFNFLTQFLVTCIYFYCLCKYSNSFNDLKKQLWVLSIIIFWYSLFSVLRNGKMERVFVGGMYDPNDLALLMVSSLPITYMLFNIEKRFVKRIFLGTTIILSLLTIVLTKSRGGFVGMSVLLGSFILIKTNINTSRFNFRKAAIIGLLVVLGLTFTSPAYEERMRTIFGNSDEGSGRIGLWKRTIEMIKEKPFLGFGVGNFTSSYGIRLSSNKFKNMPSPEDWAPSAWATAHNSFLLVAVELGIPGLIIFLSILGSCLRSFRKIRRYALQQGNDLIFFSAGMLSLSFLSFIICAFFISSAYSNYLFFLVGMAVMLGGLAEVESETCGEKTVAV